MVLFNYSTKELTAKIVYYGPGLCGKTTNLQFIHQNLPQDARGKMLSLATKTDRTLFFDFLPIDLGSIRGMKTRVQLYTVPGQVFYNETRKLVLKGADGIVFVADSQEQMLGANVESFRNLEENLKAHGMRLGDMPLVLQFNKRDLPRVSSIEELNTGLNRYNAPFYESVATTGIGVQDTLKAIVKLVLLHLTRKYDPTAQTTVASVPPPPSPGVPLAATGGSASTPVRRAARAAGVPPPIPGGERRPAAAASTRAIPVSSFETPVDRLQAVAAQAAPEPPAVSRPSPPPPPDFRGVSAPSPSSDLGDEPPPDFGEDEIEELVGEVAEGEQPMAAAPASAALESEHGAEEPDDFVPFGSAAEATSWAAEATPGVSWDEIDGPDDPGGVEVGDPAASEQTPVFEQAPAFEERPVVEEAPMFEEPTEFGPTPVLEPTPTLGAAPGQTEARAAAGPADPAFEVDRRFDPEWPEESGVLGEQDSSGTPSEPRDVARGTRFEDAWSASAAETAEAPGYEQEQGPELANVVDDFAGPDDAVDLTEIASDRDLFEDPDIEVARLTAGENREIVVPVEVREGHRTRRFKLSIHLRLDGVD